MPRRKAMWRELDEYWQFLQDSALADKSIQDYYYFAECFVRWIDGEFRPGQTIERNKDNV